jgi:hypothetical protein
MPPASIAFFTSSIVPPPSGYATVLGAWGEIDTEGNPDKELLAVFILFNTLTVHDGIDVQKGAQGFSAD